MADESGWYNGYSPKERSDKLKVYKRLLAAGTIPPASGPCMLCGDPETAVEYHTEDYSYPYLWRQPAAWHAFMAHVRRGGYARDLKNPKIKEELVVYRCAIERGEPLTLPTLRPYHQVIGSEWFANLRLDPESLQDPSARPRPMNAPAIASPRQYEQALLSIRNRKLLSGNSQYLSILKALCRAPNHTTTATQLADALGFANFGAANLHLGALAHHIADELGFKPDTRKDGSPMWWQAIAYGRAGSEETAAGHFEWTLRPELVAALQKLKWA